MSQSTDSWDMDDASDLDSQQSSPPRVSWSLDWYDSVGCSKQTPNTWLLAPESHQQVLVRIHCQGIVTHSWLFLNRKK